MSTALRALNEIGNIYPQSTFGSPGIPEEWREAHWIKMICIRQGFIQPKHVIAGANGDLLRRKQPWRTRKLVKTLWIIGKFSKVDHIAFWKHVPLGYVLGRSTNTIELHILEDILQALKNVTLCLFSPRNLTRRHNVKRLGVTVWLMDFWDPYLAWCSYMWVRCLGVCVCVFTCWLVHV